MPTVAINHPKIMKTTKPILYLALSLIITLSSCNKKQETQQSTTTDGPYLATGIKIGEVDQSSAIIWARLTKNPERVSNDAPLPEVMYKVDSTGELIERRGRADLEPVVMMPESHTMETIQGATPGAPGKVRLNYKQEGTEGWITTDWVEVSATRDYTHQFEMIDLDAGLGYDLLVEAGPSEGETISAHLEGHFRTAPAIKKSVEVNFIVTTGTAYNDVDSETGFKLYPSSIKLNPEFFVHTGDILYYDHLGKTAALARWHWDRMYSFANHVEFHRQIPSYFIKDDHDTWMNDCWPGQETRFMGEFTYEEGTRFFMEEVTMKGKTYRTFRWGKDLQIWLMEGRDYRSPNPMTDGSDKTIWGKEQMGWLKQTVAESDATFKVLISPTPIVGPDRGNKKDNHANEGFTHEGNLVRQFISEQENMVVVCGDRHWQYVSKDGDTGILEFSCGPGSDDHAGGWSNDKRLPEHQYLNVIGGFLEGSVSRVEGNAILTFRHYSVDGEVLNEYLVSDR